MLKHNLGHGRNGFEIAVPSFWMKHPTHELDIRFHTNQQSVKNSPAEISSDKTLLARRRNDRLTRTSSIQKILEFHSQKREITIVIPIFNAYEEVKACVQTVTEHTSIAAKLLLINDCSPDPRIVELLDSVSTHPNITAIHNAENLGYTSTINLGIETAKDDDIVLLNSDTRVGPNWLQNLQRAVYHDVDIATATAISDNAGAFSVPNLGESNQMPVWLTDVEMNRAVSQCSERLYPEIPTGSGFCIYIRRDLLADIGSFDADAFPRGYGEENDFCMRAIRAGWRHVVDDSTLVYHVRSASFKAEKQTLIVQGREVVDRRYPEYKTLTPTYRQSPTLQFIRYNVRRLIESPKEIQKRVLPRILYVISTRTGGTPQTNADLMDGISDRYHPFLLHCDSKTISLYDTSCTPHQLCEVVQLDTAISAVTHRSTEYEKVVSAMLVAYSIELLHIRHIVWHSLTLPKIAKQLGIPIIFSLHDFYTICPTVNLLDETQTYCGGHCTSSAGDCSVAIWPRTPPLKHSFISTWQRMMEKAMESVDAFVTTAGSAKEQLCSIYPTLKNKTFPVIPHGRDFSHLNHGITIPEQTFRPSQPLRILFPGNISIHKGANIIADLHRLDSEGRLEIHFLGTTDPILKSIGHHHGTYQRSEFFDRIQKIRPHYVGIFSIWPETYCHTLTEAWSSGVPVVALDRGAVGERMRTHGGGWLINSQDIQEVYDVLLDVAKNATAYTQKLGEVRQWQQSYGRQNNVATMSAQYHNLYQQVWKVARPFHNIENDEPRTRLGVFVRIDRTGKSNPSTHVRVLDWLRHPDVSKRVDVQFLDVDTFLQDNSGLLNFDIALVQRNTIKPYLVDEFIQVCTQRELPIIFELDDDLMNVPAQKDPQGTYARTAVSIKRMLEAASTVIASTHPLAKKIETYNNRVTVIPNALPEFMWLSPAETVDHGLENVFKQHAKSFKILYMGNPTHSEDLAMVKPAFKRLSREGKPIQLFVVGGEHATSKEDSWYERIDIPAEYRHYPEFVKWLRSLGEYFDMAIAPLTSTDFNKSKSALKYVQYSAMRLPAIYSNCIPYSEVINDGINGILANSDEASWYQRLLECHTRKNYIREVGKLSYKNILENHLMSAHTDKYVRTFETVSRN